MGDLANGLDFPNICNGDVPVRAKCRRGCNPKVWDCSPPNCVFPPCVGGNAVTQPLGWTDGNGGLVPTSAGGPTTAYTVPLGIMCYGCNSPGGKCCNYKVKYCCPKTPYPTEEPTGNPVQEPTEEPTKHPFTADWWETDDSCGGFRELT